MFMATASSDCTAKLWNVLSFKRDLKVVETAASVQRAPVSVIGIESHSDLDGAETPLNTAYHGTVVSTFRHEASVNIIAFASRSSILVTSSADCTCKLWDVHTFQQVFQINLPSAVEDLRVYPGDKPNSFLLYLCIESRIMVLRLARADTSLDAQARMDVRGLSSTNQKTWPPPRRTTPAPQRGPHLPVATGVPSLGAESGPVSRVGPVDRGGEAGELLMQFEAEKQRIVKKGLTRIDIKKHLAHGTLAPEFLTGLIASAGGVNERALKSNMARHKVSAADVLRAISDTRDFRPRDVLAALAAQDTSIYQIIHTGGPLSEILIEMGYLPLRCDEPDSAFKVISLKEKDVDRCFCYVTFDQLITRWENPDLADSLRFHPTQHQSILEQLKFGDEIPSPFLSSLKEASSFPNFSVKDQLTDPQRMRLTSKKLEGSRTRRKMEFVQGKSTSSLQKCQTFREAAGIGTFKPQKSASIPKLRTSIFEESPSFCSFVAHQPAPGIPGRKDRVQSAQQRSPNNTMLTPVKKKEKPYPSCLSPRGRSKSLSEITKEGPRMGESHSLKALELRKLSLGKQNGQQQPLSTRQRASRTSPKSPRDPLDSPASQGKFARFRPAEQFRIPGLEIVWGPSRSAGAKQKAVKSSTFCQPLVLLRNSSGGDNVCVMVGSGERVDSISENGRIQT
eukprot:213080_1